jgi:hypothetical protein
VWHDGRDLPSCSSTAGSLRHVAPPCRRGSQRLGLNAVGYCARCIFLETFYWTIYFSKIKAK